MRLSQLQKLLSDAATELKDASDDPQVFIEGVRGHSFIWNVVPHHEGSTGALEDDPCIEIHLNPRGHYYPKWMMENGVFNAT